MVRHPPAMLFGALATGNQDWLATWRRPQAAHDALALLLIGPQLFAKVNRAALEQQADEVVRDKHFKKSERKLSHPLLLRRYHAITNPTAV